MAGKNKRTAQRATAVQYAFAAGDDPNCALIRRDVDDVLADASDHGIKSTTPNETLLTLYMWPQAIAGLHRSLNNRLQKYPNYEPFGADAFDEGSSVGDVRSGAYEHCHANCSAI
jgi:hypothetical protein